MSATSVSTYTWIVRTNFSGVTKYKICSGQVEPIQSDARA